MLELINVKKTYETKAGPTVALDGVNIKFADKGLVCIIGKSGCGKTTLLNVIGGLDNLDSGDIIVDGKKFSEFSPADYDSYRNTLVGFVFQEYNLLSEYTIEKNIDIANELQGKKAEGKQIDDMLKTVEIGGYKNRKPNQLSGGQKQRVAIARALIKSPKIILADEPTGALDSATGIQVMNLLKELSKDKLVIIVSHELEFAEKYADRIIKIVDGKVVEDVSFDEIEVKENIYDSDSEMVVKSGADLTEEDSKRLALAIKEKKKVNITEKISVRQRKKTGDIKTTEHEPIQFIKSKMKFKSVLGFGTKSITVKPFRLAITILLSVIAFAVFGLFDSVASYNGQRAINDMLKNSGYSAVSISAVYNNDYYNNTEIKMTQSYINQIKKDTGYNFRGVYDIQDIEEFSYAGDRTNFNRQIILQELNFSITGIPGKEYYYRAMSGIVEFKSNEIEAGVLAPKEYNYKIIHGKYPELNLEDDGVQGVGISSYMVDSIMYWLTKKNIIKFADIEIQKPEDFIGAKLKFVGVEKTFRIDAIIDCGEIPEKFEKLSKSNSNLSAALLQDFSTFINAGGFLTLFLPSGYVDLVREQTNRKTAYVGNYNEIKYTGTIGEREHLMSSCFYNVNEFDGTNSIMFDDLNQDKAQGVIPSLEVDQGLVHISNLKLIYEEELSKAMHSIEGQRLIKQINETLEILDDKTVELLDRRIAAKEVLNCIEQIQTISSMPIGFDKTITIKSSTKDQVFKEKLITIKGLYLEVDTDKTIEENVYNYMPLVLSDGGFSQMNIVKDQGIYSRAMAGLNAGYFGAKRLSKQLSKVNDEGVSVSWYRNGLFSIIDSNADFIGQIARLFLYIALVVVGFSVFMLFNYISTSIVSKRQTIGILRALGTRSKSIFEMFLIESIIITIISGAFACIAASISCVFVNNYILGIIEAGIRFALFGARQIIIIMIASIITGILASLLPIIRIIKEKPVALIRQE